MNIESCIIIGDTHFGKKNFNKLFFKNQLKLFTDQIIPYMKEHSIKHIIQTGDLFDNRIIVDIQFLDSFCTEFIELLRDNDITLVSILGNHDVYYKNDNSVNLSKQIEKMYKNVIIVQEQTTVVINNKKCLLVPWLLENETINYIDENYIIGHFEIKNFQLSKGNIDEKSKLDEEMFSKYNNLEKVLSGHYHINQESKLIHYIGVPYELDWGDFQNKCGFYHLSNELVFIENTSSDVHVKITWDENNEGAIIHHRTNLIVPFKEVHLHIKDNYILKITNIFSVNNSFEELLFYLKEKNIKYNFFNNQELETMINPDNIQIAESKLKNTDSFVLDYVKDNHPELTDLIQEILKDIKEEIN